MVPFIKFFRDPLSAGRIASCFAGLLSFLGTVLIARDLKDTKLGALTGFFYVICPFCLWYDRIAITEGLLLALFVFAVFFAIRAANSSSPLYFVLTGVFFGLALLTKGTAQLLVLIIPFTFLFKEKIAWRGRGVLRWIAGVALSLLLGFAMYNALRISPLFGRIAEKTSRTTKTFSEVLSNPFDVFFTNFATILKTLWVFLTPPIFILSFAGLILGLARRWRPARLLCLWVVIVWVVESLIAKHWMFPTILPRFFLILVPPLLIAAGYFILDGFLYVRERSGEIIKVTRVVFTGVLALMVVAFPLYNVSAIVGSPSNAVLPEWIRFQYLEGWPAGIGVDEVINYLKKEISRGKITVGSNMPGIGLPTDALYIYFRDEKRMDILTFRFDASEIPMNVIRASRKMPAYIVFNMFSARNYPPSHWPVRVVRKFPKGEASPYALYLLKVVSP